MYGVSGAPVCCLGGGILKVLSGELGVLFDKSDSDKQESHYYGALYDWLIAALSVKHGEPLRMLEIGVSCSDEGSFHVWQRHAALGQVVGVDFEPYRGEVMPQHDVVLGDAYTDTMVDELQLRFPNGFHLIIDDGSHNAVDQRFFLDKYSCLCVSGGYLVVEDVASWQVYEALLEFDDVIIVDTSWNRRDLGNLRAFHQDDSRIIVKQC